MNQLKPGIMILVLLPAFCPSSHEDRKKGCSSAWESDRLRLGAPLPVATHPLSSRGCIAGPGLLTGNSEDVTWEGFGGWMESSLGLAQPRTIDLILSVYH